MSFTIFYDYTVQMEMKDSTLRIAILAGSFIFITVYILTNILLEAHERAGLSPAAIVRSGIFDDCRVEKMTCDITAYCPNSCCNTGFVTREGERVPVDWSDRVAAGSLSMRALLERGIDFAAVDTAIIPLGSVLMFNGKFYAALDRGSAIRGGRIDIAFPTHGESENFGIKLKQDVIVYIPRRPREVIEELKNGVPAK